MTNIPIWILKSKLYKCGGKIRPKAKYGINIDGDYYNNPFSSTGTYNPYGSDMNKWMQRQSLQSAPAVNFNAPDYNFSDNNTKNRRRQQNYIQSSYPNLNLKIDKQKYSTLYGNPNPFIKHKTSKQKDEFLQPSRSGMLATSADYIGLGTDLLGSIGIGLSNHFGNKNLSYNYKLPNFAEEKPVSFDTKYHNEAELAAIERNRLNMQNLIGKNTLSSNTALDKMQESNANAMLETNKIIDEKANKEAELRNVASQNEQQVAARNAQARNAYYQKVVDIENQKIDQENANKLNKFNNLSVSLQGIQGAANNFLTQAQQRYEDRLATKAMVAASKEGSASKLLEMGYPLDDDTLLGILKSSENEDMRKLAWQNMSRKYRRRNRI